MSPRKRIDAPTLDIGGAKIGEPDPETIVDTDASSRGTPSQPDFDPREELRALRKQIDSLRQQVSAAAQVVKGSAKQAARQTEATGEAVSCVDARGRRGRVWCLRLHDCRPACRSATLAR